MSYYSDNGVDNLLDYLGILPGVGLACDVGANNGLFNSNTLHFEEQGWIVLCVEPNPLLAEEGRSRRRLWREVACSSEDGTATFFAVGANPYASSSTIGLGTGQPFEVQVLRLDRVLEEAGFTRLDYLTIDVEGHEKKVLAGFTIERWKPTVLVVETWVDDMETPVGYRRQERRQFDNVYIRETAE